MTAKGVFITGTDTEVGKTVVAVELIEQLKVLGKKVVGYKPVASDAKFLDGILKNQDAINLIDVSSVQFDYATHNPYAYEKAISPNIAAAQIQQPLSLDVIQGNYEKIAKSADIVVVEGAGGWRSPLSDECSAVDLVRILNIPVILVVELKLGCINHALLSSEVMLEDNIDVLGWIANGPLREMQETDAVLNSLIKKMPYEMIGKMGSTNLSSRQQDFAAVCRFF